MGPSGSSWTPGREALVLKGGHPSHGADRLCGGTPPRDPVFRHTASSLAGTFFPQNVFLKVLFTCSVNAFPNFYENCQELFSWKIAATYIAVNVV